jgi:hypothetical protein
VSLGDPAPGWTQLDRPGATELQSDLPERGWAFS